MLYAKSNIFKIKLESVISNTPFSEQWGLQCWFLSVYFISLSYIFNYSVLKMNKDWRFGQKSRRRLFASKKLRNLNNFKSKKNINETVSDENSKVNHQVRMYDQIKNIYSYLN